MQTFTHFFLALPLLLLSTSVFAQVIIDDMNPDEGEKGEKLSSVGISGSQFYTGTSVVDIQIVNDQGVNLIVSNVNVFSSQYIEIDIKVPTTADVGFYDVIYSDGLNQSTLNNGFYVGKDDTTSIEYKDASKSRVNIRQVSGQFKEKRVSQQTFSINNAKLPPNQILIYTLRSEKKIVSKGKFSSAGLSR
ncbi:MAG: hypothetical protein BRD50_08900 [Bacteroidetes bacterium SW_11_45_7]|nr:MAG: hypothetical protein BRD50_08900 [Bacteroidetes bacterium SW_11_45_7]